jgi:TDG/mug DNA glycosylase family protein
VVAVGGRPYALGVTTHLPRSSDEPAPPPAPPRPTKAELEAARGRSIPDVIAPHLRVLFCGINPGLYSGATGHHFANPGNRFWPALHLSGFTPTRLVPGDRDGLLALGLGVTNLVNRTTATASELTDEELRAGADELTAKVERYKPRWLAVLGIGAYRTGFRQRKATLGPQFLPLDDTRVWVLPNPSGINAHYQLSDLAEAFAELRGSAP